MCRWRAVGGVVGLSLASSNSPPSPSYCAPPFHVTLLYELSLTQFSLFGRLVSVRTSNSWWNERTRTIASDCTVIAYTICRTCFVPPSHPHKDSANPFTHFHVQGASRKACIERQGEEVGFGRHLLRKVHQDAQIQVTHYELGLPRTIRKSTSILVTESKTGNEHNADAPLFTLPSPPTRTCSTRFGSNRAQKCPTSMETTL